MASQRTDPFPYLSLSGLSLSGLALAVACGFAQAQEPDDADLARAHYRTVEAELRATDVSHLDADQRAARRRVIEELAAYRRRGTFTENTGFPGARKPYFVDDAGRLCAVANLLDASGEHALVDAVAATNNHAWVAELAGEAAFLDWLDRTGLTFEEAARIQVPGFTPPPPSPDNLDQANPGAGEGGPSSPGSPGPGERGPAGPPPEPTSPPTGFPSGPPSGPLAGAPTTSLGAALPAIGEDWWTWWEFNKLAWIAPNRLSLSPTFAEGVASGERTRTASAIEELRRALAPTFRAHLEHEHAAVRAAAARGLARAGGAGSVPELAALVDDASLDVRASAILALGASGSEEGVHALLKLASGTDDDAGRLTKPWAAVALGIARASERGAGTDRILPSLLPGLEEAAGDDGLLGYLFHQTLAPSQELGADVRCRSGHFPAQCGDDAKAHSPGGHAAARAVEALRYDGADEVTPRLLDALGERELAQRRSAALALGGRPDALPALKTAYELEREPLTRGFLLLSIADCGGDDARDFLIEALNGRKHAVRPWAALALGRLARADDDAEAREALRARAKREGNRDTKAACLVALGIARDAEARPLAERALGSSSEEIRLAAGLALGLIGDAGARPVLRRTLADEGSPRVRSALAQSLALFGDRRDAELLIGELEDVSHPGLQGQLAVALGFHGSQEAIEGLLVLLARDGLADVARAAALDALGILLADRSELLLGRLSQDANFTIFPAWMIELLQQPI